MKTSKIVFGLFIGTILCLVAAPSIFCQTETLDIIQFTPPQGWSRTIKDGAVILGDRTANTFCILTVYPGTSTSGNAQRDFDNAWNQFVVTPFKAPANPKTETTTAEGWEVTAGGAQVDLDGGIKAAMILTVFSGYGKRASILAIFNDESYIAHVDAFVGGVTLDKNKALAKTSPTTHANPSPTVQTDPFPDRPGYQPQQPLAGTLKPSITMADLVGTWDSGGASVTTYVDSSSGNYAGTDTTFYGESYTIHPNGTFDHRFAGRTGNHTVREVSNGVISLSGGYVIVKFTGGERRSTYKYQFISYMSLPNGGAVLSLIHIGETENGLSPERLTESCGHAKGYISCVSGDVWTLRVGKGR